MRSGLRALWDERRPAAPPARVWRDGVLVGVVAVASTVEVALRTDRAWLALVVSVSAVIALALLWRRTHPLAAVAAAFGTLIAFDVARIVAVDATALTSVAATLVLPYALLRWGSGREAAGGLGIILVWLGVTHVADPASVAEVVAGYAFFGLSAAFGASIRFHAVARLRDLEQARLQQRNELARDLHDTIGHHVSGIAVQAQAGQALASSDPDRALAVLPTIEDAASRALEEMRAIVGILRDGAGPDLAPQPGIRDIARLASDVGPPSVDVRLSGATDDVPPSVGVALHRIAQEALTNARRHARHATRVDIEVHGEDERVRLTVRDDGDPVSANHDPAGFGLLGMRERTGLLGGTLVAGPHTDGGWIVVATLPTGPAATARLGPLEGRRS